MVILSHLFAQCDISISGDSNVSHFFESEAGLAEVEDLLKSPTTSDIGGIYYYSEHGDGLIYLGAFHDKLWNGLIYLGAFHEKLCWSPLMRLKRID
ncbi:hypothetical protein IHE45_18G000100 [Dioscorea alata]|uniref:Uncharacterized protein n=1 Tax=Dioscorea alata TaxID=55571 RepID=A0ACB7U4N0_DIOAL|nr:hypothetical protein IHE45_18G000100 [Dioscorea alata]